MVFLCKPKRSNIPFHHPVNTLSIIQDNYNGLIKYRNTETQAKAFLRRIDLAVARHLLWVCVGYGGLRQYAETCPLVDLQIAGFTDENACREFFISRYGLLEQELLQRAHALFNQFASPEAIPFCHKYPGLIEVLEQMVPRISLH